MKLRDRFLRIDPTTFYLKIGMVLVVVWVFITLLIVGAYQYDDEVDAEKHYCEMVKLWNSSNGEQGWPDFHGMMADGRCK